MCLALQWLRLNNSWHDDEVILLETNLDKNLGNPGRSHDRNGFSETIVTEEFVDAIISNGITGGMFRNPQRAFFRVLMAGESLNDVPESIT